MSERADPVAVAAPRLSIPRLNRLGWLLGLYADNFRQMERLFGACALAAGHYRSSVSDGRDVCLDVLECHPWTCIARLTYADLIDPLTGTPDPSAYLRLYRDSHQLEATHCYSGRNWHDVTGLHPSAPTLVEHRLRMNTFLGKWLHYLRECGHGSATLRAVAPTPESAVP